MADKLTIITNHVPRFTLDAHELTTAERAEFDYLDWQAIEDGRESASFFRYKNELHDLGDMEGRAPDVFGTYWHAFKSDTFFSGILVHYCDDHESVIVGRYYS